MQIRQFQGSSLNFCLDSIVWILDFWSQPQIANKKWPGDSFKFGIVQFNFRNSVSQKFENSTFMCLKTLLTSPSWQIDDLGDFLISMKQKSKISKIHN